MINETLLVLADRVGTAIRARAAREGGAIGWESRRREPRTALERWNVSHDEWSLYGGCGGVGAFLSDLSAQTGCRSTRADAGAALMTAARAAQAADPRLVGMYTGRAGIALALGRHFAHTQDSQYAEYSLRLTEELRGSAGQDQLFDIIGGAAGVVVAMCELSAILPNAEVASVATEYGLRLTSSAIRQDEGVAWGAPRTTVRRPLVGFSHGTAGIAKSLLDLFELTGDRQFRSAALLALDHERASFKLDLRDWPDRRSHLTSEAFLELAERPSVYAAELLLEQVATAPITRMAAWCHGAPGMLRAWSRASTVVEIVAQSLEDVAVAYTLASLRTVTNDSVCHGRMGNLAVLASYAQQRNRTRLEAFTTLAAERFSRARLSRALPWSERDRNGIWDASLMCGLAGVGQALLAIGGVEGADVVILGGRAKSLVAAPLIPEVSLKHCAARTHVQSDADTMRAHWFTVSMRRFARVAASEDCEAFPETATESRGSVYSWLSAIRAWRRREGRARVRALIRDACRIEVACWGLSRRDALHTIARTELLLRASLVSSGLGPVRDKPVRRSACIRVVWEDFDWGDSGNVLSWRPVERRSRRRYVLIRVHDGRPVCTDVGQLAAACLMNATQGLSRDQLADRVVGLIVDDDQCKNAERRDTVCAQIDSLFAAGLLVPAPTSRGAATLNGGASG